MDPVIGVFPTRDPARSSVDFGDFECLVFFRVSPNEFHVREVFSFVPNPLFPVRCDMAVFDSFSARHSRFMPIEGQDQVDGFAHGWGGFGAFSATNSFSLFGVFAGCRGFGPFFVTNYYGASIDHVPPPNGMPTLVDIKSS